ncbi:hypothetical protein AMS68_004462 [Peltaster fructicola]|uniref:Glutamine amidotransferase domain-containing protein n=1 Tax=Peltaster fructicola TaxID=286661 RepID=A0A6H0XWB1_9PEZI|nr:hypothetical protein AMS68_004462 [Peltaster fructicola]
MRPPLRIAILECDEPMDNTKERYGGYRGVFAALLKTSAEKIAKDGSREPQMDITAFDVVKTEMYPSLDNVDAVLLTGSKFNAFDNDPWILKLVDFTRKVLNQQRVRLIGVCFGHQIIGRALDVKVDRGDKGWEISVTPVQLSAKGQELFGVKELQIHQMHRDIVYTLPPSVESLGRSPVCEVQGMYARKRLITVQGHPEFTAEIVDELIESSSHSSTVARNATRSQTPASRVTTYKESSPDNLKFVQEEEMGKHSYGIVLDAGSSGTRVYIYRWEKPESVRNHGDLIELAKLPKIKTKKEWIKKIHPGVSTFGAKPELVGPEHLAPLLDFALDKVPTDEVANTPIFLLATAGMRLLPDTQRSTLLGSICSYFTHSSNFLLPDCDLHIQVIPGETEGLYGWIAANYLLGGFDAPERHDHGKGHHTYGFLDMGGASAQIAFAPNETETQKHANDLKLLRLRSMNGTALEHKVFVTTWLGFGANEARRRYVEELISSHPAGQELPDPCLPVGLRVNKTGDELPNIPNDKSAYLKDEVCKDPPCLLNGIHTPAIDFDVNHFVGVSEFWHTTHEIFAQAHKDKAYDLDSYQKQVIELCSRNWSDLKQDVVKHVWGQKVDERTVEEVCFKASWLINMLHSGIGIPRVGVETGKHNLGSGGNKTKAIVDGAKDRGFLDAFQAVDKIDGTEVSWTLGKIVLYASSQVPAAHDAEAVGFGSNKQGVAIPYDFQYPSVINATASGSGSKLSDDEADWHDRIFSGSYSQRVPGILIFLLILALAVYLLCGRERRASLWNRFFGGKSQSRRKKIPALKLFGSNHGPAYERVNEEMDDADVELGSIAGSSVGEAPQEDFASTSPPRTGRTSGVATPAPFVVCRLDYSRGSAKIKGYFDRINMPNTTGSARLVTRSRNSSPSRAKTPLATPFTPHSPFASFKTSVD